jgi:TBC1 domain family protein 5
MRAPDGSYEDGFIAPGGEKLPARAVQPGNLERNNPLSLHDEVRTPFDRTGESVLGILTMLALRPL